MQKVSLKPSGHWRCRFKPEEGVQISKSHIVELLTNAMKED
ncbi:MAG: hypothetical protein ACKO1U_09015, partial [Bacteroidota bacterium]